MKTMERGLYVVKKDFSYPIGLPMNKELTHYNVGEQVRLRITGKMAKIWLEKGYIELVSKIGC